MRHLKLFDNYNHNELIRDINGLLVELNDNSNINFNINGPFKSVSGINIVNIFFKSNKELFDIKEIYNQLLTIESYLREKEYVFSYEYDYYSKDDDEDFTEECKSISYLNKRVILEKIPLIKLKLTITWKPI